MGYRYRAALFNLFLEDWNYRAITSQHISETYCYKFCMCLLEYLSGTVFIRIFFPYMRKQLRKLIRLPALILASKLWIIISQSLLEAPMIFVGFTALSVDINTNRSHPCIMAA